MNVQLSVCPSVGWRNIFPAERSLVEHNGAEAARVVEQGPVGGDDAALLWTSQFGEAILLIPVKTNKGHGNGTFELAICWVFTKLILIE